MNKRTPVVGEKLFEGTRRRRNSGHVEGEYVTVIKVGRKYFSTARDCYLNSPHCHTTYHIDTWREKTDFPYQYSLYENEQEFLDQQEVGEICVHLRRVFSSIDYSPEKLGLLTLRKIRDLVNTSPTKAGSE